MLIITDSHSSRIIVGDRIIQAIPQHDKYQLRKVVTMLVITGNQIVAHLVGDYIFQSDWMANEKTRSILPALVHAFMYTIPFLLLTQSWSALLAVAMSHFVIDRWRLGRFVCYAKNYISPMSHWYSWAKCSLTGYHEDRPPWLTVWLLIITDNTLHLLCNAAALSFLG